AGRDHPPGLRLRGRHRGLHGLRRAPRPRLAGPLARHSAGVPAVGMDVARFPLRLLVIGDSIAYGTGARRPEDALGPRLTDALVADGFDVDLHVLAVPGAVSPALAA